MNQLNKPTRQVNFPEIPFEEFSTRKQKAMELMVAHGIDGLVLFNPQNLNYFSGYRRTWTTNWPQVLVFSREGRMGLIVPQILDDFSHEATWIEEEGIRPYGGSSVWGLEQDPLKLIVKTINDLGLAQKTIGVEVGSPNTYMIIAFSEFEAIKKEFPQADFVDAVPMIWQQRMIKTPWEQDAMRKVAEISVKGVRHAMESAREGMTEKELLKICWHTFIEEGACDTPMAGDMMFRGGATKYSMPTPRQVDEPFTRGQQMFFDGGASYKGYYFDFQRHISFGDPPALHRRLMDIAEQGQSAAEAMIKPGNLIKDVHQAAMSVIDQVPSDLRDQGVEFLYSHTFMGHGEGLCMHEPPWITADSQEVIRPGMVLALEVPALDIPQFRVLGGFNEDVYLVTEDGHEMLTAGLERKEFVVK